MERCEHLSTNPEPHERLGQAADGGSVVCNVLELDVEVPPSYAYAGAGDFAVLAQCVRDGIFAAHRAVQLGERAEAGERWRGLGTVLTTKLGTPIEPRNMNRHLDMLCERAGLPRIRFHDLRHSYATLLYDRGVSIEHIQDVLGHSSPTVTKTIYVESTRKVPRDAIDRRGFLFDD